MEEKDTEIQKEGTLNSYGEKKDHVEEQKAIESSYTDKGINDKNPNSRH